MSTEKSPAFQFYPKDWLSDARVLAMDAAARGVYINLLCVCWMHQELPSTETDLRRLASCTPRVWRHTKDRVLACFTLGADGRYRHKRLDEERQKQLEFQRDGKKGGDASVKARTAKYGSADPRCNREAAVNPPVHKACEANVNSSSPSPSPSPDLVPVPVSTAPALLPVPSNWKGAPANIHARHVFCGRVCVWDTMHAGLCKALGGDDPDGRLRAFYREIDELWSTTRAHESTGANSFDFWRQRYDERWPGPAPKSRRELADEAAIEAFVRRHADDA